MGWLRDARRGHPTPAARVPLVSGAVVYDLWNGDPVAPDADAGRAACDVAATVVERGLVGAGTGCTAGKLLGPDGWTRTGIGAASLRAGDATVVAVAAPNPVGDVIGRDGSVLAGARRDGAFVPAIELLASAHAPIAAERANTTLVAVATDARLTKLEAYLVARAMGAGVARAVNPCATAWDGDLTVCMASGEVEADAGLVAVMAGEAATAAIRDAATRPGSAGDRRG
jgi:L-aminopeptidase/D-esterase-like protein